MNTIVTQGRAASLDTQFGEVQVRPSRFSKLEKKYCAELIEADGQPSNNGYFYAGTPIAAFYGLGDKLKAAESRASADRVAEAQAKMLAFALDKIAA